MHASSRPRTSAPRVGEVAPSLLAALLAEAGAPAEPAAALAGAAVAEALAGSGLDAGSLPAPAGLVLGTCLGGAASAFDWLAGADEAHDRLRAGTLSSPAERLAEVLSLEGPVVTLSIACASGSSAVARGTELIHRGAAELVIAVGVDVLTRFVLAGFHLLRALASEEVRPFDLRRDGLALGEGAGALVLEERERALRRGAPVEAEVLGWGSAGDANPSPSPDGDGVVRAVRAASRRACRPRPSISSTRTAPGRASTIGWRPSRSSGSSGPEPRRIPVDSIKPSSDTLRPALEAIPVRARREGGIVPPTAGAGSRSAISTYVPNGPTGLSSAALSCSFRSRATTRLLLAPP